MGELESLLPDDIKKRSTVLGNELAIPYGDTPAVIAIASEHQIAVLGFDCGELIAEKFQVLSYSGYDREVSVDQAWKEYVSATNALAEKWFKESTFCGSNCRYILTSTSENEFLELRKTR
jgi:hypothetical protein